MSFLCTMISVQNIVSIDMNIYEYAFKDIEGQGGGKFSPCIGPIFDFLPMVNNRKFSNINNNGISIWYIHKTTASYTHQTKDNGIHWYASHTIYGREKKTYRFILGKEYFCYFSYFHGSSEVS